MTADGAASRTASASSAASAARRDGGDHRGLLVRAAVNRDGLAGSEAKPAGHRNRARARLSGGAYRGGAWRANRLRRRRSRRFAPASIVIVWPGAKSATLVTLMLVAPAVEAADRVVAGCTRKSVQLLSVSAPSGKRPTLRLACAGAAPPRPPPCPPATGAGTRQPALPCA